MPYSDDMYSGSHMDDEPMAFPTSGQFPDAGDDEEELDETRILSPTDGYFGPGMGGSSASAPPSSHVPDVWVRDPSLDQSTTAEGKAREAAQERWTAPSPNLSGHDPRLPSAPSAAAASPTTTTTTYPYHNLEQYRSYARSSQARSSVSGSGSGSRPAQARYTPAPASDARSASSRRESIYSERSSLFPSEAPPAYTPSPSSPSSASGSDPPSFARHYRTFPRPAMGRDEETRGLLASDPQSMGGRPGDEFADAAPLWRQRVRRRMPRWSERGCFSVLLCLVLLFVTLGSLASVREAIRDAVRSHPKPHTCLLNPVHTPCRAST